MNTSDTTPLPPEAMQPPTTTGTTTPVGHPPTTGATHTTPTNPDLHARTHRVLALYDHPPDGGRVICMDEFGPLHLQPRKGQPWRHTAPPPRLGARRPRRHGVMYLLAALDLTTGRIHYRIRRRQRHHELLDLLKSLRSRWPEHRLHLVLDNFAPHRHPAVRAWAHDNNAELVFLPTYSSWLNWIEPEFTALRHLALGGTDHHTHAEQNAAIAAYIRRRNNHARPKTGFATDSPVRTWIHLLAEPAHTTPPRPRRAHQATEQSLPGTADAPRNQPAPTTDDVRTTAGPTSENSPNSRPAWPRPADRLTPWKRAA